MYIHKIAFPCLICFLLIAVVLPQIQGATAPSDKLAEHYYYKCYNQTRDLKIFEKLSNDVSMFTSYLEYTFSFIPNRRKIFCDTERKQLNLRIEEIAKDLEPCLPPSEKYLSEFVKTSFKEFIHFFCHNDGENMKNLFSPSNQQCRESLERDITTSIDSCFGKIFRPLSGYLSQKDLCDDVTVAEKCFALILDQKCPSSQSYRELNRRLFEYIRKPCSGCVFHLNILLLVASIILPYLFNKN